MASRDEEERNLESLVAGKLRSWLGRARDAVMQPFRQWKGMPDAAAVYATQGSWNDDVDTIVTHVGQIALRAWSQATDVPPVSRHAFIMASLADTHNFLVRVPDEVANLVFAEITDAVNAGADVDGVAAQVERVLSWTDTERWPGRAKTIAWTETTRARGAGTMAAGTEQARVTGRVLTKEWRTRHDEKVRISHRDADGDRVAFWAPFYVGGEPLMFPGDPNGSPDNVINCRCDLIIRDEVL
jgi:hypothetical protein